MHIQKFCIENLKCFEGKHEVTLSQPDRNSAGWYVFAGRNGAGKTSLLKALAMVAVGSHSAIALEQTFEQWVNNDASITAYFYRQPDLDGYDNKWPKKETDFSATLFFISTGDISQEQNKMEDESQVGSTWSIRPRGWFICGYGASRNLGPMDSLQAKLHDDPKLSRLTNLFYDGATLLSAQNWLTEMLLAEEPPPAELFSQIEKLLNDGLLPDKLFFVGVDRKGLLFKKNEITLNLKTMSDGYRVITALVLDIIRHLYICYKEKLAFIEKDGKYVCELPGVVLIDEIDAHMHISWQQKIGFWFRDHFPNIQFIVTTHSPFICQAATPGGLILLPAPGSDEKIKVADERLYRLVTSGSLDEVVMSELFGLDHPHSDLAEKRRQKLSILEGRQLIGEQLSADEETKLQELRKSLPHSISDLVDQRMRALRVKP